MLIAICSIKAMKTTINMLMFIFLISPTLCQKSESDKGKTTCTAPAVKKGDEGNVTCYFPFDVNNIRPVTLTVERYPPDTNSPVAVLDCSWVSEGIQPCQLVHDGYTFDGHVDTTLSLKIKRASDAHVGRYACKMMSSSVQPDPKTCAFQLKEDDPMVDGSTTGVAPSSEARTKSFNTTEKATPHPSTAGQEEGSDVVIVAVVVPVVVVIIAVAVVAVVVCYRKKKLCFDKKPSNTAESAEQREEEVPLKGTPKTESVTAETETRDSTDEEDTDKSNPVADPDKEDAVSDDEVDGKNDDSDHSHAPPDNKP